MGEGIRHVRDEHGGRELLLELLGQGQFKVFDPPGHLFGLDTFVAVQQGDPRPVAGRIADRRDVVEVAVGKHPEDHRLRLVDIAPEGARQDHPLQFFDSQFFHHQFRAGIEGAFGELDAPDILLTDRYRPRQRGFVRPGDNELRFPVGQTEPRRCEIGTETAASVDDACPIEFGHPVDDPGAADPFSAGDPKLRPPALLTDDLERDLQRFQTLTYRKLHVARAENRFFKIRIPPESLFTTQ